MNKASFKLGDTEFGLDPTESSCVARKRKGRLWLSFEANGDQAIYDSLTSNEDSPWSWMLSPPRFYGEFPATQTPNGTVQAKINVGDLDEYEVALYLMEHNDVDQVLVRLYPDGRAKASGIVDLMGKQTPFQILWPKTKT